jgi:hypothetical protein
MSQSLLWQHVLQAGASGSVTISVPATKHNTAALHLHNMLHGVERLLHKKQRQKSTPQLVPVGLMDACDSADFWEHATTTIQSREAFVKLFAILLETVSLDPS